MTSDTAGPGKTWPISRWAWITAVVAAILLGAAITAGASALARLTDSRSHLLEVTGPQVLQANALSEALLNQETGIRGYLLARQPQFLEPYRSGLSAQDAAVAGLRRLGAVPGTPAGDDLDRVLAAAADWRAIAADPVLVGTAPTPEQILAGKTRFDLLRAAMASQQNRLDVERVAAREDLSGAAGVLTVILAGIAILLAVTIAAVFAVLHRRLIRPIRGLAEEVRDVTRTDITRHVHGSGPREMRELAADVESLRARITDKVTQLENTQAVVQARTQELERSNADLEQFAYVASHDLQEPLRKVASFCQLLQKRYQGKLDERGDQYIAFAVDGAKRMQVLINDLLAFSRIGRRTADAATVDADTLLDEALSNLDTTIVETGARIDRGELPAVWGESVLLTVVFQNLIGNALKFRGESAPEIAVSAERDGDHWRFCVTDNGIGVDSEHAERIFVIFQRLHGRSDYPGTGIGLALCRKIVEHHGGAIWLDTDTPTGTRFCFTFPADTRSTQLRLSGRP
ncbi:histidine kinase [Amycolatopsis thailandensis]|uniref:histidine kinase n=1 Tax=Amycolatopsis thailandensis TaxID=589330 RepID=A0A229SBB2_9PSEU|nr:sensor histidine kinase [Amycolatopsis thailandensis]OXM56150.1 histidine kinase [Amycolatopsis thailandensis]